MNQGTIQDSLVKHLEVVERSLFWALAIAIVVGWAGIRGTEPIEIVGIKTSRDDAYFVASFAFIFANIAILIALIRLGDLLRQLGDDQFIVGAEKIMVHSFLLNPFAFFGTGELAQLHSCIGSGLLVLCWWLCYSSLSTFIDFSKTRSATETCLLLVGLASLLAISRVRTMLVTRTMAMNVPLGKALEKINKFRAYASAVSTGIGVAIFIVLQTYVWHRGWKWF